MMISVTAFDSCTKDFGVLGEIHRLRVDEGRESAPYTYSGIFKSG